MSPLPWKLTHPIELVQVDQKKFMELIPDPVAWISKICLNIQKLLYNCQSDVPHIEFLRLIVEPRQGIAETVSEGNGRFIYFNSGYLESYKYPDILENEVKGILVHELVHVYQSQFVKVDGEHHPDAWAVTEGLADFVRLKMGYVPPHWNPEKKTKWNQGYEGTAYFLVWIENHYKVTDFSIQLNYLVACEFDLNVAFQRVTGHSIEEMWKIYINDDQ